MRQICPPSVLPMLQHAKGLTTVMVRTQRLVSYRRRSRPSCKSKAPYDVNREYSTVTGATGHALGQPAECPQSTFKGTPNYRSYMGTELCETNETNAAGQEESGCDRHYTWQENDRGNRNNPLTLV